MRAMSIEGSFARGILGRAGVPVFRLGLPTSYGITTETFEYAIERGVNYFYWGWMRDAGAFRDNFVLAIRNQRQHRDRLVITGWGQLGDDWVLKKVLHNLRTDYLDVLLLSLDAAVRSRKKKDKHYYRILKNAIKLKKRGLVRILGVIDRDIGHGHTDKSTELAGLLAAPEFDIFHVQYNPGSPSMETGFIDRLSRLSAPALVATGTASRDYLNKCRRVAEGEPVPTWEDCYRFVLSHPAVSVCLCSAVTPKQLDRAFAALDRGPMTADELGWMRRIGGAVARLR